MPTPVFTVAGARSRDRIENATVRRTVFALLAASALNLAVQALRGLGVFGGA